ncbi:MAG TPA: ABC transporter ATP-binding protein [Streptosporangiaceae bacterium]|nr:ABC transporter ATP-binding protein [Streptosporangiaceae bacterium]
MNYAMETDRLGKRYGRRWALADCTLTVPAGQVVGLVGPNGAGKTTLLELAVGLLRPTTGTVRVPARTGFVAQDAPVYAGLTVADHLRMGQALNERWDDGLARRQIGAAGLDPGQRAGRLSGGQRARLALALAVARRPDLLILDEPVANLDPLARREFLDSVAAAAASDGVTVVFSSHLVADLERACGYLIVLAASQVRLAGPVRTLLSGPVSHKSLDDLVISYLREGPR